VAAAALRQPGLPALAIRFGFPILLAGIVYTRSRGDVEMALYWQGMPEQTDSTLGQMCCLAKGCGPGESIFVMSVHPSHAFPLVNYSKARWPSKYPCLWPLTGLYPASTAKGSGIDFHDPAQMSEFEREFRDAIVAELIRARPAVVFVDETTSKRGFQGRQFDYLAYLNRHPDFPAFFAEYEPLTKVETFGVYQRRRPSPGPAAMAQ
jgi:hypothetical protein